MGPMGWVFDPTHQSHTLDLTSEAPILRNPLPIQLLSMDLFKHTFLGSRSERGGARRALTKRVRV